MKRNEQRGRASPTTTRAAPRTRTPFADGDAFSRRPIRGCAILYCEVTEVWQLRVFMMCYLEHKRDAYQKHFGVEPPEDYK